MFASFQAAARHRLLRPMPLLRYLFLTTETHALCGSLAFFAMLGFYPLGLLLLTLATQVLHSPAARDVVRDALREYYPTAQTFLLQNLEASSWGLGERMTLHAALWILLGGAGVFIPLETAFNRLWGFEEHRPYWRNQWVGLLLTAACWTLTVGLVLALAQLWVPLRLPVLRVGVVAYTALALFLLYRVLPNGHVPAAAAVPAALLTAVATEVVRGLYMVALPLLQLPRSQGPYHVSVSFLLLAYAEAFVLLAGAYLAAETTRSLRAATGGMS
jgi:membrane protein